MNQDLTLYEPRQEDDRASGPDLDSDAIHCERCDRVIDDEDSNVVEGSSMGKLYYAHEDCAHE